MLDLESKRIFLFDLDDTLIDTHKASQAGLKRAYQSLISECISDFDKLPSYAEFETGLKSIYSEKDENGKRKYFDYEPEVFEDYCNGLVAKELKLRHYEYSLAARLCWSYRDAKNSTLMTLPRAFEILKFLRRTSVVHCITEGRCNYQHTKAMLTEIEKDVESVHVVKEKINDLKDFIEEKKFNKRETVMIGDSESDILAGKKAEINTICIKSGNKNYDEFKVEADLTLNDLNELLERLKSKTSSLKITK